MAYNKSQQPQDIAAFLKVRKWCVLALGIIALVVISSQVFIQIQLGNLNRIAEKTTLEIREEYTEQFQQLKTTEYVVMVTLLLTLILLGWFVFRPVSFFVKKTISELLSSEEYLKKTLKETKEHFKEKERSLEDLKELSFVIDNAALYASINSDGRVAFMSKKFLELLGATQDDLSEPLSEILTTDDGQQQYLNEVLKRDKKNIRSEEIEIRAKNGKALWLDMSIIPMHKSSLQQSTLILCSDITKRKTTQFKVEQLTKQSYEESIRQKQLQAGLIVEGQEEERKRIAKDIHDGIGQMLTALKFNIESINLENKEKSKEKIIYIKGLTADLIKGVRTATFNLTPPELQDHGIFPALQKMTRELAKLTGKNILFENTTDTNMRFDSLAETNIYRVVQEAVNNAIKYANANYILVTIKFSNGILSIKVDDDGEGFNTSIIKDVPKNNSEGGMGLFFMKERMGYINGRLFINSEEGEGTRVTINYKKEKA